MRRSDNARLLAAVEELQRSVAELRADLDGELLRLRNILQVLYDREPEMRERLHALRGDPDYERAFTDPEPLVTVVMTTWDRYHLLLERSLPSVFAQTYGNLEIVIVGDHAPPEAEAAVRELGDPRIRFSNLERWGPYPGEPVERWHVAGVPPRNEAVRLARGQWIAPLDDDDAFLPDHVERLLDLARRERAEVAYGKLRCLMNDGSTFDLGEFPPRRTQFGWQGAIFHAGLSFFEMELANSLFHSPSDWSLCRRMLRAGVRFAWIDDVVVDHWESRQSSTYDEAQL
jgi:glycosyltransferase involved in cell wall biosynthesis